MLKGSMLYTADKKKNNCVKSRYVKICQDMSRYVKICQDMSRYVKASCISLNSLLCLPCLLYAKP